MTAPSGEKWKVYAEKLASKDRQERIDVLNELAGYDDMPAVRLLLKGLSDLSSSVRAVAAEYLKQKDHPAVVPGLIALLDADEFYIRNSALDVLKSFPAERIVPEIRKRLDDEQVELSLKKELIPLLATADDLAGEKLKTYLSSEDETLRSAAVDGLVSSGADWAVPLMIDLLDDTDSDIRMKAMNGLKKSSSEQVVPALLDCLSDPGLKGQNAVTLLSELGDESLLEALSDALQSPLEHVRERALMLMEVVAPKQIAETAVLALGDPSESIRKRAIGMLSGRPESEVLTALEAHFPGTTPRFAELAAYLLARIGSEKTISVLMKALQINNEKILKAVLKGVKNAGTSATLPFFKEALKYPATKEMALAALSRMKTPESVRILIELWGQPEWNEKVDTLLTEMDPEIIFRFLETCFEQAEDPILKTAIALAGRLGFPEPEKLDKFVVPDNPLAKQACRAVGEITLRSELSSKRPDAAWMSLSKLTQMILETKALSSDFDAFLNSLGIVRLRNIRRQQTSESKKKIEENIKLLEFEHKELEKKIGGGSGNIMRLIYLLIGLTGLAGTVYCFYMNWRTMGRSFWYPAMVGCVAVGALGFFGFTRTKGRSYGDELQQQKIQQQIQVVDKKLERLRRTLKALEDPAVVLGIDPQKVNNEKIMGELATFSESLVSTENTN